MPELNSPEIQFAMNAVRQASLLVRQIQQELVSPALTKEDRSPVTIADYASQALVGLLLKERFPNDVLVAEEDSTALREPDHISTLELVTNFVKRIAPQATPEKVCAWIDHQRVDTAERFWTLDPIDGTKGFLRSDQYAIALALVEGGLVQVGVLGCPNLSNAYRAEIGGAGSLVVAARGRGAWSQPLTEAGPLSSLSASHIKDPSQARVLRSFESGHTNVDQIDEFAHSLGIQADPVRMDSQAKYAVLAAGQGELYLRLLSPKAPNYREKIWDQAAGWIILAEAGGIITDLDGQALDFTTGRSLRNNRGILASNGALHPWALKALREVGA